jgi:hypothetical protein
VVAAATQDGVAAWKLASNAMARSDSLGVKPVAQHDGTHVDAISNHVVVNVGRVRLMRQAVQPESRDLMWTTRR